MFVIFIIKLSSLYYWKLNPTQQRKRKMSEGKKTLVVVEDLDRVILQEQFLAMGLDIEVVVDREKAASIVTGLTALPTMHDEMTRIIGQREYGSDFRRDSGALADRVAKEFNAFCLHYNFKALRDSVIGKMNYELAQGPDSGGNPALQDSQREASVSIKGLEEVIPSLMMEVLKELKGIKEAVTSPTLKVDFGPKERMGMSSQLRELLSTPRLSMPELIDGLQTHFTTRTEPTTMTLTNVAGASIKLGNHTFERNEDGSLKILTDVNGKSNTVILNTDGGVMLHGPGYMG